MGSATHLRPAGGSALRVPQHVECLEPYIPGWMSDKAADAATAGARIYLASNENPLGCSQAALEALRSYAPVHRYPRGTAAIRYRLANALSVNVRNVIVGNGSDSLIGNIVRTFAIAGDEAVTSASTFPSFSVQAKAHGFSVRTVPYRNWAIDLDAIAAALTPSTKIVYLPNPNNPTGSVFTDAQFREFHSRVPASTLVILDQAYYEYAMENPDYTREPYLKFENVIALRTFSKAYGLAGLRIGYGIADEALIAPILKTQLTFECNSLAQSAAAAALDDHEFVETTLRSNRRNREWMVHELSRLGYKVPPSAANFVMLAMASRAQAERIAAELLRRDIAVRPLHSFGLPHCIRVTVGTDEETKEFLLEMRELSATLDEPLRPE